MHIKEMVMNWTLPTTVWPTNFLLMSELIFLRISLIEFVMAGRVYILDMYNSEIYPFVSHLLLVPLYILSSKSISFLFYKAIVLLYYFSSSTYIFKGAG